jgi:hypothetical protein
VTLAAEQIVLRVRSLERLNFHHAVVVRLDSCVVLLHATSAGVGSKHFVLHQFVTLISDIQGLSYHLVSMPPALLATLSSTMHLVKCAVISVPLSTKLTRSCSTRLHTEVLVWLAREAPRLHNP